MKTFLVAAAIAAALVVGWMGSEVQAQSPARPSTENLLPETTAFYIQIRDLPEFVDDMRNSSIGQMMQDEKMAPLVDELWAQARENWERLSSEQQIGVAWDDIVNLAHGEVCFAMIAPRRADAQFAFFLDIDEEEGAADRLLQRGREFGESEGATFEEEETEDAKFMTVNSPDGNVFTMFRKDGTIVVATNRDLAQQILDRWNGRAVEKIRPLTDNRKFVTVMNRCRSTRDEPPELRFFVDPIEMAKSLTRGQPAATVAFAALPVLGLDGVLALGGTSCVAEGDFQTVNRMHVMLANPRAGILEMLALKPGDYAPGQWVPADCPNFMTASWDIDRMVSELQKMVDFFSGEGTFENQVVANINRELELDFRKDIVAALNGTVTFANWVERPFRVNSQATCLALGLRDAELAEATLRRIMDRVNRDRRDDDEERMIEDSHEGVTLWRFNNTRLQERFEAQREEGRMQISLRAPEPAFAIIGETLVMSDSAAFLRLAIETERGRQPRLADLPEFKLVSERTRRLLRGELPAGIAFSQPDVAIEQFYELARGEEVMNFLRNAEAEDVENRFIGGLRRALEDHPLPEFEHVRKYFMPQGAYIVSDDTGYQIMQFELRSKDLDSGR